MSTEDEIRRIHEFEMFRNGSGNGECAPFPHDNPVCGWAGHISEHPQHVAEVLSRQRPIDHL